MREELIESMEYEVDSKWKEYKLDKITEPIKETYNPDGSNDFIYIGLEHIEQETLKLNSVGVSSDVTSNKFKFQPNDVLFGKLRPYFRKVVKPQFEGICSTDIWVFRAKKGVNQNYLFYFLANKEFVDTANSGESGSRMPRADWSHLKATNWIIPPLSEQTTIASILSSLDDKIDLLHRQNKTLEQLAETLFRQWFVEEAEVDLIPLKKYVEVIDNRGKTPPFSDIITDYPIVEVKSLSNNDRFVNYQACEKFVTEETYNTWFRKGHPIINDILISTVGSIGEMAYVIENKGGIAQNVIGLRAKGISPYYLYQYLSLPKTRNLIKDLDIGAVQPSIKVPHLLDLEIIIPKNKQLIKDFEAELVAMFEKMKINHHQIRTLTQTRDTLLPKLMSGEVRVEM